MGRDGKIMGRPWWQTAKTSHPKKKKKMHKAIQYEGSIERRENKLHPGGNSGL